MPLFADDSTAIAGVITLAILALVCLGAYLFPSFIALFRRHPNTISIFVVNLFLGWLLIGWVIALAWSVSAIETDRRYRH